MNTKSIFEILRWTNVTLELGKNIAGLFGFDFTRKKANTPLESAVNVLCQALSQGNNQTVDNQIHQKFASATGTGFSDVERFKAFCGLAIYYATHGDMESMKKNISAAEDVSYFWARRRLSSRSPDYIKMLLGAPTFLTVPLSHDEVALQELHEMLPLLEEIRKYKSQS